MARWQIVGLKVRMTKTETRAPRLKRAGQIREGPEQRAAMEAMGHSLGFNVLVPCEGLGRARSIP